MTTQKQKFEELKNVNSELFNQTLSDVIASKSAYLLTNLETGEKAIKVTHYVENEDMPYDKAAQITIAGAICFPQLGVKVENLGKIKYKYGEYDFDYYSPTTRTLYFAAFRLLSGQPYVVNAQIRFTTNPDHKNYGKCHIYTDMQFNPIVDHPLHDDFAMTEQDAKTVLSETGFTAVKPLFDWHNIEDLKEIKPMLSAEWIEAYNTWANYTG